MLKGPAIHWSVNGKILLASSSIRSCLLDGDHSRSPAHRSVNQGASRTNLLLLHLSDVKCIVCCWVFYILHNHLHCRGGWWRCIQSVRGKNKGAGCEGLDCCSGGAALAAAAATTVDGDCSNLFYGFVRQPKRPLDRQPVWDNKRGGGDREGGGGGGGKVTKTVKSFRGQSTGRLTDRLGDRKRDQGLVNTLSRGVSGGQEIVSYRGEAFNSQRVASSPIKRLESVEKKKTKNRFLYKFRVWSLKRSPWQRSECLLDLQVLDNFSPATWYWEIPKQKALLFRHNLEEEEIRSPSA